MSGKLLIVGQKRVAILSDWLRAHSKTSTPTPTRPTRRHPRDDLREDVGEAVGVGVVQCGLYKYNKPVLSVNDYSCNFLAAIHPHWSRFLVGVSTHS